MPAKAAQAKPVPQERATPAKAAQAKPVPQERATPVTASTTAHAAHLKSNTARWEP